MRDSYAAKFPNGEIQRVKWEAFDIKTFPHKTTWYKEEGVLPYQPPEEKEAPDEKEAPEEKEASEEKQAPEENEDSEEDDK